MRNKKPNTSFVLVLKTNSNSYLKAVEILEQQLAEKDKDFQAKIERVKKGIDKIKQFYLDNGENDECPECFMPNGEYVIKEEIKQLLEKEFGDDGK